MKPIQILVLATLSTGCDQPDSAPLPPTHIHGKKVKNIYQAKVVGVVDGDTSQNEKKHPLVLEDALISY